MTPPGGQAESWGMAWRIDEAVTRGEIDNTVEGRTTGRIWLAGRSEPLVLALDGDCWRDIAGSRLFFENPTPHAVPDSDALDADQTGLVGDMTASRKNKVPDVSDDELSELLTHEQDIPFVWRNILYLEWFSEINGRVVIESGAYRLKVSPHEWHMDEDAENAQKLANLSSMRDFMAQMIRRRDSNDAGPAGMDEFAWEERLKETDRLTDAYQEVLEKYMEDADSEQKEAFVMGWDGLLDALADRDESDFEDEDDDEEEGDENSPYADDDDDDFFDELFDKDAETLFDDGLDEESDHPLQKKAQELAIFAMEVVVRDAGPGTPSYELITNLLQVSGKLAGVLHSRTFEEGPETGLVLAILKRCMAWLNEAMRACQTLIATERDAEKRQSLTEIRQTAFEIRNDIVALRRELK